LSTGITIPTYKRTNFSEEPKKEGKELDAVIHRILPVAAAGQAAT
jgi:hypothetical protein